MAGHSDKVDADGRLLELAHDAVQPFPKVFWAFFGLTLVYLVIVFAATGSHYVSGAH